GALAWGVNDACIVPLLVFPESGIGILSHFDAAADLRQAGRNPSGSTISIHLCPGARSPENTAPVTERRPVLILPRPSCARGWLGGRARLRRPRRRWGLGRAVRAGR